MKNNVLALYDYKDSMLKSAELGAHRRMLSKQICFWISYVIDVAVTITVTCCTVFCCYLAWTML